MTPYGWECNRRSGITEVYPLTGSKVYKRGMFTPPLLRRLIFTFNNSSGILQSSRKSGNARIRHEIDSLLHKSIHISQVTGESEPGSLCHTQQRRLPDSYLDLDKTFPERTCQPSDLYWFRQETGVQEIHHPAWTRLLHLPTYTNARTFSQCPLRAKAFCCDIFLLCFL